MTQLFKASISSFVSWTFCAVFRQLNHLVRWDKWWRGIGLLNLIALRADLRKYNLHGTPMIAQLPSSDVLQWSSHFKYTRTADGSFNDLGCPAMGMAGTRFGRNFPLGKLPDQSTITDASILHPNPREVSRTLLTRNRFRPAQSLNLLAAAWIQFQVHDWFRHKSNDQKIKIPLQADDDWKFAEDERGERVMSIKRTQADESRTHGYPCPPTFLSDETHWWDGSQIYGSTINPRPGLRLCDSAKLRMEGRRLPQETTPGRAGVDLTGSNDNWWIGLSLMHSLFALEHNAICDRLKREYPSMSDEEIFQKARLINVALISKIHTIEWTPAILDHPSVRWGMSANWWGLVGERITKNLGRISTNDVISGIPGSTQDHHGAPFCLTEEFVSVYRMHPLLPDEVRFYSAKDNNFLCQLSLEHIQGNHTRDVMNEFRMEDLFYSFGVAHPGAITLHNFPRFLQQLETLNSDRMDLAAVDILRDRERGVPRYNKFRELLRISPVRSFEELTGVPRWSWLSGLSRDEIEERRQWAKELETLYDDVNDVDLMVGLFAERPPKGFGFSDTAFRIFILMASRRLKSDRFLTTDYTREVYTQLGLDWINQNGLKSVIQRHYPELTGAMQNIANPFAPWERAEEPRLSPLARVDFSGWPRLTWFGRRAFWNWWGVRKFLGAKPAKIKEPPPKVRDIQLVPLKLKLPSVPIDNIMVADHVPKDEKSFFKRFAYRLQVIMYRLLPPMQNRLPSIPGDPFEALQQAYTKRHRRCFPPPVLPPEYESEPDLGFIAVAGPYAGYLKAVSENKYTWDLRDLRSYQHHPGLYNLGCRVLFRVDHPLRALKAYEIETELGTAHPGDRSWRLATKIALCAVSTHTSLVRHFNWIHLASGAKLSVATRNCLPHDHPLCILLWPHIFGTQQSNEIVTEGQMVRMGDFETIFGFTHDAICKLFSETYKEFDFIVNDPEEDAIRRGLKNVEFELPSQKNFQELFDVFHEHAQYYLGLYYHSDNELQQDQSIRAWLEQLQKTIPNGIDVSPHGITIAALSRLIARFIYLVTVQHEALGTNLWNYQLWTHRQPARVYKDGGREPLDIYQRLVNANFNLNVKRTPLIEDFSGLCSRKNGKQAFKDFRTNLQGLQSKMENEPWAVWKLYPKQLEANINA